MAERYSITVLDEGLFLGLVEVCTICRIDHQLVFDMVNEGLLSPEGPSPDSWRFDAVAIKRIQITRRLQNDLGVNLPGAALALDLLDELEELRCRLRRASQLE